MRLGLEVAASAKLREGLLESLWLVPRKLLRLYS
jgi:hypothetical protein